MDVRTKGRFRWWLKFSLVQAALVLLLLELVLRIYNPVPTRVRGNEIVLPVRQVYRFDNGFTQKIDRTTVHTKNALGFRGPDPPRDFADRLTIVTIGGSTTESLFLSDGRTWTDAMARRLERDFPGVWVNNAGIDGHTTFGHLILLKSFIIRLHPKVAVFLIGANDVGLDRPRTFDEGVLPAAGGLRHAANAVAEHSEIVNLLWNLARAARARERGLGHSEIDLKTAERLVLDPDVMERTEAEYRQYLPGYAQRLGEIADLTRANGIQPVWITQPALFGDGRDPATGVELATIKVNGRGNGHLEWRLLEMHNDVMRQIGRERDIPLIDLARELPKDSRYFYDFLHFTNDGSEKVGEIVAAQLAAVLSGKSH
jgi:lysophospholipase L1-like esterase